MDNLFTITEANQLQKIFDTAQEKLVILMFFTKNPMCRSARGMFEKIANNNTISIFCVVDMEKFEGDHRFVNGINNFPQFDFYHLGAKIASVPGSNAKDLESSVQACQRYVITQGNLKNNSNGINGVNGVNGVNGINGVNGANNMGFNNMSMNGTGFASLNPVQIQQLQQVQQQILNSAAMQNPMLYQQLIQNPMLLQQYAQKQMGMQSFMNMPQNNMLPQMQPQMQAQMQQPMQSQLQPQIVSQMPLQMQPQMQSQMPTQQMPLTNSFINPTMASQLINPMGNSNQLEQSPSNLLPTFQQMQQMFQIWNMMQEMGIVNCKNTESNSSTTPIESNKISNLNLHSNVTSNPNLTSNSNANSNPNQNQVSTDSDGVTILPNGDKIIPLPGGKFGLVKNPNNQTNNQSNKINQLSL